MGHSRKDEPLRRVEPGDQVYLRMFKEKKWNEPRREGPYKVTNACHRGGREFPISWSSALVSRRILYLIYLNDELINVPLWVMFLIDIVLFRFGCVMLFSHDCFDNEA